MHLACMAHVVLALTAPLGPFSSCMCLSVCMFCDNRRLRKFICDSLSNLDALSGDELVAQRYERFRALGSFDSLSEEDRDSAVATASGASKPRWAGVTSPTHR